MNYARYSSLLLRIGLAAVFLYAAVAAWLSPYDWIGYLPDAVANSSQGELALQVWGVVEVGVALWLLSGWKAKWSGLVAAFLMLGVIVQNITIFDIVFRDAAILFMALALSAMSSAPKPGQEHVMQA